jgi:coenzyme F420-dependent glucose-6-phosphate dehydrogenase
MKIYWYLGAEQFQPEVLVQQAAQVESAGFEGVAVSDHFHPWVDDEGAAGFSWSTLGAIAAATERLELMTAVVTPLWHMHPAVVAQAAATIDRLSGGRFALGVGTGRNEGMLGYPYPPYAERAARMVEALDIMRRLLDDVKLDYNGKFYQTKGARLYSPPVSRVPIYMSAGGPKSARLAAAQSDGVIDSVKSAEKDLATVVNPAREESDGSSKVIALHWTVRGENDYEAWKALEPWRGLRAPNRDIITDPAELRREADELPREQILGQYTRVRTADDYVRVYGELARAMKPDILVVQTTSVDQAATIDLVGREVLPELRKVAQEVTKGGRK